MKNLLLVAAATACSFNFNTAANAADFSVNVGKVLNGVNSYIEYSSRYDNRGPRDYRYKFPNRTVELPATFVFGARTHTGALAIQLREQANSMCLEAYHNYRNNPAFTEIYRDMYKILTDAEHIIDLTNDYHQDHHDVDHIASDLYEIDQLFHKVESGVKYWRANNPYHAHLPEKMEAVEDTIHHLMEDYGVKSKIGNGNVPVPFPGNNVPDGFGARLHIRKLAMELNRQSANMCLVAHGHYRNNPAFREIYQDMYKLMKDSQHILELANVSFDDDHIAADLNEIDQLFHKIESGTQNWRSNNPYHADLPEAMEAVEDTIHHLMEDYGIKSQVGNQPVPIPYNNNVPQPFGNQNSPLIVPGNVNP